MAADYLCATAFEEEIDAVSEDDYYLTERQLFRKSPKLKALLSTSHGVSAINCLVKPLDYTARRFVVDWPLRAGRLVAEFRADASSDLLQADVQAAVSSLAERSAEFRRFWTAHDVVEREGGVRAFKHPTRGALRYEQVNLRVVI